MKTETDCRADALEVSAGQSARADARHMKPALFLAVLLAALICFPSAVAGDETPPLRKLEAPADTREAAAAELKAAEAAYQAARKAATEAEQEAIKKIDAAIKAAKWAKKKAENKYAAAIEARATARDRAREAADEARYLETETWREVSPEKIAKVKAEHEATREALRKAEAEAYAALEASRAVPSWREMGRETYRETYLENDAAYQATKEALKSAKEAVAQARGKVFVVEVERIKTGANEPALSAMRSCGCKCRVVNELGYLEGFTADHGKGKKQAKAQVIREHSEQRDWPSVYWKSFALGFDRGYKAGFDMVKKSGAGLTAGHFVRQEAARQRNTQTYINRAWEECVYE